MKVNVKKLPKGYSIVNGKIVNTKPFDADPVPPKISKLVPNAVHHSKRIDQPYVRKGWLEKKTTTARGNDEYVPVTWEDAIDLTAKELIRVKNNFGNEAIFGGSYGDMDSPSLEPYVVVLVRKEGDGKFCPEKATYALTNFSTSLSNDLLLPDSSNVRYCFPLSSVTVFGEFDVNGYVK